MSRTLTIEHLKEEVKTLKSALQKIHENPTNGFLVFCLSGAALGLKFDKKAAPMRWGGEKKTVD